MTPSQFARIGCLATCSLVSFACASAPAAPTHFGRWGVSYPLREPDRSVIVAAVVAATTGETDRVVLARYAGDLGRRIDLASLDHQVPIRVDSGDKLGPVDTGPAAYRARVFDYYFPGGTSILELSAPDVRGESAAVVVTRWDALAWKCDLSGRSERLTFRLREGHWILAAAPGDAKALVLHMNCP